VAFSVPKTVPSVQGHAAARALVAVRSEGALVAAKASTWVGLEMAFNGHALRTEVYAPADRHGGGADA